MTKYVVALCFVAIMLLFPAVIHAADAEVLGMHILSVEELPEAKSAVSTYSPEDRWHFVTIPFTLDDVGDTKKWQSFMDEAKNQRMVPIVRLVTKFDGKAWIIPSKKDITDQISFLAHLNWPTKEKHIIIYNEVNHAKEWGGLLSPESYAETLSFASHWAASEDVSFVVLPAAMDQAAPNGKETMEGFRFLSLMLEHDPEVFSMINGWNSHSYPNPGFSASPKRTGKNSIWGFEDELAFLEKNSVASLPVYITETGWEDNASTRYWLSSYYEYALQHVWSDPRVVAVTPFILKGDPGPFSTFSFITADGNPTRHYVALQSALRRLAHSQKVIGLAE